MSKWKPGDELPFGGIRFWFNARALKITLDILKREYPEAHAALLDDIREQVASPVAMIDPEDREAVERLLALFRSQDRAPESADIMQAALREYANPKPPRPDEPQGLYARVEDADGRIWVRTALQASVWRRESVNSGGFRYLIPQDGCEDYSRIAVVRVLSPGVEIEVRS